MIHRARAARDRAAGHGDLVRCSRLGGEADHVALDDEVLDGAVRRRGGRSRREVADLGDEPTALLVEREIVLAVGAIRRDLPRHADRPARGQVVVRRQRSHALFLCVRLAGGEAGDHHDRRGDSHNL